MPEIPFSFHSQRLSQPKLVEGRQCICSERRSFRYQQLKPSVSFFEFGLLYRERESFVEAVLPRLGLSTQGKLAFSEAYGSGATTDGRNVYSIERWTVKPFLYPHDSDGEIRGSTIETVEASTLRLPKMDWSDD